MEYNDWADWGQSDWGNGWTSSNTLSQNYGRQPTPKEQENTNQSNRQNKLNQSASGYFENNSVKEDDWFTQNQAQNIQGQTSSYTMESIANNNINQIENREVAPPDNRQSYENSQTRKNQHEPPQNRPNQPVGPPKGGFTPARQPSLSTMNNSKKPINITNYFGPNQTEQTPTGWGRQPHPQSAEGYNSQISMPSNIVGEGIPQERFVNEPHFSSGGNSTVPGVQCSHSMTVHQGQKLPHQPGNQNFDLTSSHSNFTVQANESQLPIRSNPPSIQNHSLTQPSNLPGQYHSSTLSGTLPLGKQSPTIQSNHANIGGQKPNFHPQNAVHNLAGQQFPQSSQLYYPQTEGPLSTYQNVPNHVPSGHLPGGPLSLTQSSLEQKSAVPQQPLTINEEQQLTGSQLPPSAGSADQQPVVNQPIPSVPIDRPPSVGNNPPNFPFVQQKNSQQLPGAVQQVQQQVQQYNEESKIAENQRFTPSPQQKKFPDQFPSQIPHPSSQSMNSEVPETKPPVVLNSHQSAFHVSNVNIYPPIATSSPLTSVNRDNQELRTVENQEGVPDNKEYPDNTETISQDLKALKISSPRDNEQEQEAQNHCAIDRNQYLETGQFSSNKDNIYVQNIEVNDEGEAPPPGLHRLVTGQGYEPWQAEPEVIPHPGQTGESTPGTVATRQSSPLSSIGGESEGRDSEKNRRREVPGEAEPLQGRVVLGQVPTPPQDTSSNRGSNRGERERDRLERMVVGEQGLSGNTSDDYRQSGRPSRHPRHVRNDSSYEEEERDYSSDRDRRNDDHRLRDERPRRRREHRSPEYRSDEEYEDRRGYHRSGRESRRRRDYSPDRSYYRDYYRDEDPRHRRSYYPRDYDDYYRENPRSRPSSRSGSDYRGPMKHSMRVLPGHHYYHESFVAPTPSYHDYNLKYSQRTIEYFERMRHVDPAGYAAWYSQYMQGRLMQESNRGFSSDRASVHSGQSSSNQRHGISTPQEVVDDLTRDEDEVDYTPKLYDCAHIRGTVDGFGRLIVVEPNYPLDHQRASVNICRLSQVSLDKDSEDFFQSPGPFIPGVTHRNTVLQYLKRISDRSTKSSEKLLYDLVHMTVKGNGEVNGSDVAELLMESYKRSMQEDLESSEDHAPVVSNKEIITRFRELLQQGNKAEALDWAMENGAWGHALFLASKMGERTHNDIMLRFANSIPHNDPLQTLYQLMSGYIPQSASCCADKKWSDWRPHLAMILSNPTGNINLDRQAIITLGDSLNASGRLFASHFCYVTAQVEFSEFSPEAKLVLLGSSHNQEFSKFATCRSIMLTMCYEYGLKLRQPTFSIPTLQVYKLILSARLIDNGRIRSALQYCDLLAQEILGGNASPQKSLISVVIDFSSRLKMLDPVLALSGNTDKDPDWLSNLKQLYESLPDEQEFVNNSQSPLTVAENSQDLSYQVSDNQSNSYIDIGSGPVSIGVPTYPVMNQTPSTNVATYQHLNPSLPSGPSSFQPLSQPTSQVPPRTQADQSLSEDIYHASGFMPTLSSQAPPQHNSLGYIHSQAPDGSHSLSGNIDLTRNNEPPSWETRQQPPPVLQTSSESSQSPRNSFFKATEEQLKLNEVGGEKKKEGKHVDTKATAKGEEQSSGWFGGIWDKLALRPKNQMRLPDDSNPSIIWDEEKKKWVNLDGDNENSGGTKPPPKASEALPPQGNKYKIQKGKLMKSNYVDVMGNKEKNDNGSANFMPSSLPPPVKTNFFIPSPVEGNDNAPIDFITPAPHNPVIAESSDHNKQQLSRSSSVSSLSREVQFYMAPPKPPKGFSKASWAPGNVPPMYNTSRFPS